jgi:2-polyprenyl-3-methyl-5-hydroxy-6-metoxy-1,4-benzoquinol methylase
MAELLLLQASDPTAAASPELGYLHSYCRLQAAAAFAGVEVRDPKDGSAYDFCSPARFVLLLGSPRVLLTARSLAAMRSLLEAPAEGGQGPRWVSPRRLAATDLAAAEPAYTLRGYELLEERFLSAGRPAAAGPASHLPVSLWTAAAFSAAVAQHGLPRLLVEPDLLAAEPGAARAGLFHEFIDYYGEVRSDIVAFIPPGTREVLEVGCGRGVTGRLLQETLGCRVTGVELNPAAAAEAARHLHRVLQGDVQELELSGTFDLVLALEVFEHLTRAEDFLVRLARRVRPGGRIVLSIPNVGHYSVVEDLLRGRWDYLPIGLLCYTHYRFFTRRTLEDWLGRCGFSAFELVPQKTEQPERVSEALRLPGLDRESLATKGFYVIVHC